MTVTDLLKNESFVPLHLADEEREITSCYIGDLLSWVMGRAKADCAWITIMSNINVIAVATLADVSVIIFAEGVRPEEDVVAVAKQKGVNLVLSDMPAYESACALSEFSI